MRKLAGGKVHSVNPERVKFPLYGDLPKLRLGAPGSLNGNVATGIQFVECANQQLGVPKPDWVKVVIREIANEFLIVIGFVRAPVDPTKREPDLYQVKFHPQVQAPVIRGLKLLFESAPFKLNKDLWYDMASEIAEDDTLGKVVCASFTKAVLRPRTEDGDLSAAGQQ